jgi:hypothetical protein
VSLTATFELFVKEKCHIMDLDAIESNEYKLEYTKVYEEFKAIFEDKIEGFILKIGSSIQKFYKILQAKTKEDENSNEAIFGRCIYIHVCI